MKKNNIILFLLMTLPTLLLTSCLKDQEDLFEDSASARTVKYLEESKKVLMSSESGWVLNYYPDREQSYGGYAYTLKFTDETAVVGTEIADDITETIESTYVLKNEDGPVIMFDTYNDYMHFFATPHGSSGAGGYEAYDGDFIFLILNISEDQNTITLKGTRSGNIMYMHRLTEPGVDYLAQVLNVEENMPTNYKFTIDGEEVAVTLSNGRVKFSSETIDKETAYVYTNDGVEFYEPVAIGDEEMTGIMYVGEAAEVPARGCDIMLTPVFPPINEILVNNDWYFAYSLLSPYAQSYFDKAKAGSDAEGEEISVLTFTQYNGSFCVYFLSGKYSGTLAFDTEFIGEDQIKLTYNPSNNYNNGDWYYANAGYNNIVTVLENTFTIEADSKIRPTKLTLKDVNNAYNYFTVVANAVSNPFDN